MIITGNREAFASARYGVVTLLVGMAIWGGAGLITGNSIAGSSGEADFADLMRNLNNNAVAICDARLKLPPEQWEAALHDSQEYGKRLRDSFVSRLTLAGAARITGALLCLAGSLALLAHARSENARRANALAATEDRDPEMSWPSESPAALHSQSHADAPRRSVETSSR